MSMRADNMHFLADKYVRNLTIDLIAQAVLFYSASRGERIPLARSLDGFPNASETGGWSGAASSNPKCGTFCVPMTPSPRLYKSPGASTGVNLFVAFFKSQRTGQVPHSPPPKNCLPGVVPIARSCRGERIRGQDVTATWFRGLERRASCSTGGWWQNPLSPQRYGTGAHLDPGGWK